jgi:hypothetical protein
MMLGWKQGSLTVVFPLMTCTASYINIHCNGVLPIQIGVQVQQLCDIMDGAQVWHVGVSTDTTPTSMQARVIDI